MKKVLIIINLVFMATFTFLLSKQLSSNNSANLSDIIVAPFKEFDGKTLLENYEYKGKVKNGEIKLKEKYFSHLNIPQEFLIFDTTGLKNGNILNNGSVVNNFTIPFKLRIRKIMENGALVDNIGEAELLFNFVPKKPLDPEDLKISYREKVLESFKMEFDYEKGVYLVKVLFPVGGGTFENGLYELEAEYTIKKEGLFILKDMVYYDAGGSFVYKIYLLRGYEYYSKVYTEIIDEYENYFSIQGGISDKNTIVKLW